MAMIDMQSLGKYYGAHKVLDNINLHIDKGQIYGLIGHSGAGKSTLLRTINGLESFEEGTLCVCGTNIKTFGRENLRNLRKKIGMIFQNFSLLARKNVFENIALPLECWGIGRTNIKHRVNELLALVGLQERANHYPANLSGGQKQRVGIARALALSPEILLCDEATSALDPNTTNAILDLLARINRELGVTMVIVTHEIEVIKKICHNAAFLDAGNIAQNGNVQSLFLAPNAKLRQFLGERDNFIFQGIALRIYFPKAIAQQPIITKMARELQCDFTIIGGKLEEFDDCVMGTLVLDVPQTHLQAVQDFLTRENALWEVLNA